MILVLHSGAGRPRTTNFLLLSLPLARLAGQVHLLLLFPASLLLRNQIHRPSVLFPFAPLYSPLLCTTPSLVDETTPLRISGGLLALLLPFQIPYLLGLYWGAPSVRHSALIPGIQREKGEKQIATVGPPLVIYDRIYSTLQEQASSLPLHTCKAPAPWIPYDSLSSLISPPSPLPLSL